MRSVFDPITEDPAELDSRADEDDREARWETFVAVVTARKEDLSYWSDVVECVSNALFLAEVGEAWVPSVFQQSCADFADLEGWDGVLSAIARAMREQAKASS